MLVAIDHGNYSIKTPHFSFVSGLTEHTVRPPMADEVLEYDGKYWALTGQRLPYMRDKTRDDRYFVLSLFAIAKELSAAGANTALEQIDLAVGLPPEHYGMLRERFAQYFRRYGTVNFVYNNQPMSIVVRNVFVYPQAYAAVVPQCGQLLKTLRMFVVDIGGYTTDVLLLRNGKPDLQFCRSLESGVITMNNDVIGKISAQHDMRIEDEHICAVLRGQETILPESVKRAIREAAQQHAKDILDKLRELQVDLRTNPAIFIGGGSILFRPLIESTGLVVSASFVEDTKANAVGYELLARGQLAMRARSDGGVIVKQNGKYRFSLQFKADSNANIAAGELLERLGNRKSAVVVAALNDYISVHPEIAAGATRISVRIESEVKRESLEEMIRALIDEKIAALQMQPNAAPPYIDEQVQGNLSNDIAAMISNLDLFG